MSLYNQHNAFTQFSFWLWAVPQTLCCSLNYAMLQLHKPLPLTNHSCWTPAKKKIVYQPQNWIWPHDWSMLASFFYTIKLNCQISDCNKAFPTAGTWVSWQLTRPCLFTLTHGYSCDPQRSDKLCSLLIPSIVTSSQLYLEPKKAIFPALVMLTNTCAIL